MGKTCTIAVDLSVDALQHHPWSPKTIGEEMRTLWLLEQVRQRRLGYGKAAELSGLPIARFLELMGQQHITPFDYDPEEMAAELRPHTTS